FFVSSVIAWSSPQLVLAIPFFLMSGYCLGITNPIAEAMTLDVVPAHLRGQAAGMRTAARAGATALGPLVLSVLSEMYGLRQGLLMVTPLVAVGAAVTALARKTYDRDNADAQESAVRHAARQRAAELAIEAGPEPDALVPVGAGSDPV